MASLRFLQRPSDDIASGLHLDFSILVWEVQSVNLNQDATFLSPIPPHSKPLSKPLEKDRFYIEKYLNFHFFTDIEKE